jgi:putative transposase
MASFSPQAVFLALGTNDKNRQGADRALFRTSLVQATIDDIRLALNQNQPLGNSRFVSKIARMTGERRVGRPARPPRKETVVA